MSVLAALGTLWRWCDDDLRGFSFEHFDELYRFTLDHYDVEIDGGFSHQFVGATRREALELAAKWARARMGEGA